MNPSAYLALSFIRNLADFSGLTFIISASFANHPGLDSTHVTLLHLAVGFAISGLVNPVRKNQKDLLVASFASLLSLGFLLYSCLTGHIPDPIFFGFSVGLGRVFWNNALLPAAKNNKIIAIWTDNACLLLNTFIFAGCLFITTIFPLTPEEPIFPINYLCMAQALSLICMIVFFMIGKFPEQPYQPANYKIYQSSWRDDFAPLIFRSLVQGVFLSLLYLTLTGADDFALIPPIFQNLKNLSFIILGGIIGIIGFYIVNHPLRTIGSAPWGMFVTSVCLIAVSFHPSNMLIVLTIGALGVTNTIACCHRACRPENLQPSILSTLLFNSAPWILAIVFGYFFHLIKLTPLHAGMIVFIGGIIMAWVTLRAFLEQLLSIALIIPYRISTHGPGLEKIPDRGPVIVIANHASYLDPFLIGKVASRRIIPMMTSVFYDLPVIHWLMSKVVKAIRVEAATFRREAPELNDAIEALKRGESLLIFPEARLRKKEDQLLFPFGQGIWHILTQLPETPIVPIWLEGAWGSYASYFKGPPFANKKMDFFKEIKIVVGNPIIIPKETLTEHRLTRKYLQDAVLANRTIIGLKDTYAIPNDEIKKD